MTRVLYAYMDPTTRGIKLLRENTENEYGSWMLVTVNGKLADSYTFTVTTNFRLDETQETTLTRVGEERFVVTTPQGAVYFTAILLENTRYTGSQGIVDTESFYELKAEDAILLQNLASKDSFVFLGYDGGSDSKV